MEKRNDELQRLMNGFKEWDWVNDNQKVFHEDEVYEMLLHLQHRFKQRLNIHGVLVDIQETITKEAIKYDATFGLTRLSTRELQIKAFKDGASFAMSLINEMQIEPDTVAISETERGCLRCGLTIKTQTGNSVYKKGDEQYGG